MKKTEPLGATIFILLTLALVIVMVGINYRQVIDAAADNLGMILATKKLTGGRNAPDADDNLERVENNLSRNNEQLNEFSIQTRKMLIGSLYWQVGLNDLAVQYWWDANIEPSFFIAKSNQPDRTVGLDYIDRAIALDPERSEFLYLKGVYIEKKDGIGAAQEWYDLANQYDNWVDPALSFDVLFERGKFLYQNQRWKKSKETLQKSLWFADRTSGAGRREIAMAHRWLGLIFQQEGEIGKAQAHFEQAIEQFPENFWNYFNLALIAEGQNHPDIAFKYFDMARSIEPQNVFTYIYPATHYRGNNETDKWRYFCDQAPFNLQRTAQWLDTCQSPE